jgi:hypothetical protein
MILTTNQRQQADSFSQEIHAIHAETCNRQRDKQKQTKDKYDTEERQQQHVNYNLLSPNDERKRL